MPELISIDQFEKDFLPNEINEGLIRTVNLKKSISIIKRKLIDIAAEPEESDNGTLTINFYSKKDKQEIKYVDWKDLNFIIMTCENLGYFPAKFSNYSNVGILTKFDKNKVNTIIKNSGDIMSIEFHPKFSPSLSKSEIPDVLYHISDGSVKEKILRIGLSPRSDNKIESHPNRVYFCKTKQCLVKLLRNDKFYKTKSTSNKVCLYKIDMSNLRNSIDLYIDPSHTEAYFTYDNIRPNYIELIQEIDKKQ